MRNILVGVGKSVLGVGRDVPAYQYIADELHRRDYEIVICSSREEIERYLECHVPDLILLDHPWPRGVRGDAIKAWANKHPTMVLCSQSGVDEALECLRLGAMQFLVKPLQPDELASAIERVLEHALLYRTGEFFTNIVRHEAPSLLVGNSAPLLALLGTVRAVAPTDATVLILGESGVGKEKVAQEIHRLSKRAEGPLVWVDCCSLQEALFESELFGHERGAFTGANQRKTGLIEQAHGGTLFLDEIGEIPPKIQAKLLRVLETRQFRRLGGLDDLDAEVRIVTATNRNLEEMAANGDFRQDLLYRLNTFIIHVAPLRERMEDIPLLAQYFLTNPGHTRQNNKRLSEAALQKLMEYKWPGNVRELRNIIERAIILAGNKSIIDPSCLTLPKMLDNDSDNINGVELTFDYEPTLAEIEQHYMKLLLDRYQGNRAEVAGVLGISQRTLYRLLANLRDN